MFFEKFLEKALKRSVEYLKGTDLKMMNIEFEIFKYIFQFLEHFSICIVQ